jgi:hypothetical protein
MRMVEAIAAATPHAEPPQPLSAHEAIELLEKGDVPRPIIVATRQRAVPGKAERMRRESFLRACGLPHLGDTTHMIAFNEAQRERSANLVRGLKKLGPTVITFRKLEEPALLLVTDDRGLRRRAMANSPAAVLSRMQLFNWLQSIGDSPEVGDSLVEVEEQSEQMEVA